MKHIRIPLLVGTALLLCAPTGFAQATPPDASASAGADSARWDDTPLGLYDLTGPASRPLLGAGCGAHYRLTRRTSSRLIPAGCTAPPFRAGGIRSTAARVRPAGPAVRVLPFTVRVEWNSDYPRERNNGVVWAGRGRSTALHGGVRLQWGPVSAAVAPVVAYQENLAFDTSPVPFRENSPFMYPWHYGRIDWPQRFGERPFWSVHPGQSYIRVDALGTALGFSTENLWWGPAYRYPVLMSNTAPGFPHVFLGTSTPVDIRIGTVDIEFTWGHLAESEYFDYATDNDRRLFAGVVASFAPRWLPGLTLGAARVELSTLPPGGIPLREYITRPYTKLRTNAGARNDLPADNGLIAIYMRLAMPEAGAELYGEWAREDHWEDFKDLASQPDHSQGYSLGARKVWNGDRRRLGVYAELAHLASPTTWAARTRTSFYTHGRVIQGYTHRGQLLGAAIGPGADAQILGIDLEGDWGGVGVYGERIRFDNTAYDALWAPTYGYHAHDVELTGGARTLLFLGPLDVSGELAYSHRWNRNFLSLADRDWEFRTDTNWHGRIEVTWRPDTRRSDRSAGGAPVTQ